MEHDIQIDKRGEQEERLARTLAGIGKKYVVLSGKGGVGKSTVAVNVAVALALRGRAVGLLDSDLHGPSLAKMLGLESHRARGTESAIEPALRCGGRLRVMSIQFMLPSVTDSVIWRGPLKHSVIRQLIGDTHWGTLDYLIVDSPPGTGDEPLSVVQTIGRCDGALVVTTPQEVAAFDVRKSIDFCRKVRLPVAGVIENMGGFICPHCGTVSHIFGRGGGEAMAAETGVPFLGSIPIDPSFVLYGDAGEVYVEKCRSGKASRALEKIVESL